MPLLNTIDPEPPTLNDDPLPIHNVPYVAFEVPLLITTSPLTPPVPTDEPDDTDTQPLPDPAVLPLLNNTFPLVPADNAFALRMLTAPDDDDTPPPRITLTTPPAMPLPESLVEPADKYK